MFTVHIRDIERGVIDQICQAQRSIYIAVAWFTNEYIMEALMEKIIVQPDLRIHIVVVDDHINRKGLFSRAVQMQTLGIDIRRMAKRQFLHHKFMVIDQSRVMVGSYNFTKNANRNRENMVRLDSEIVARFFEREFEMITNSEYIDENIHLLLQLPDFAQKIVSAYYPFSASQLKQFRSRITVGHCFSADNGQYDQLHYEPGFIFNPVCKPVKHEFSLPITRSLLHGWSTGLVLEYGREYYYNYPDDAEGLGEYIELNLKHVEEYYRRKYEQIYPLEILQKKIDMGINIIIEDGLWYQNFLPFFDRRILAMVMQELPDLSTEESWKSESHFIKRSSSKISQRSEFISRLR